MAESNPQPPGFDQPLLYRVSYEARWEQVVGACGGNRPLSLGGHVESQENKKLCFCTASLALNLHLGEACCAKTKLFILLRLNMATEW